MTNVETDRDLIISDLFTEALNRVLKGEDVDPCMAIVAALLKGEEVATQDLQVILEAHKHGPWMISNEDKLGIFTKWCEQSGSPITINKPIEVHGVRVYMEDFGDCVMAEASKYNVFAVWTRKDRLYIGFKTPEDATWFRNTESQEYSMEATGNKRLQLVVLEGGDNMESIQVVTERLRTIQF